MRASLLALFPLVLVTSTVYASEAVPKLQIDSRSWQNDDWAPGEGQSYTSDTSIDTYECSWVGEALDFDCTVTPDTPENPPVYAPDRCLWWDRTYDAFEYMYFGCG